MTPSKKSAKKLKALGLIKYDLRKNLNTGQKAAITRLTREYSFFLDNPQDFVVRNVSRKTAKLTKESGLKTIKSKSGKTAKVIIPAKGAISVKFKKGKIVKEYSDRKEIVLLTHKHDFLTQLEQNAEKWSDAPRKFFTVQIGENGPFAVMRNAKDLLNYMKQWEPKDATPGSRQEAVLKEKLMSQMVIIEIDDDRFEPVQPKRKKRTKKWQNRKGQR